MKSKIFSKRCPKCNKLIESLSENQLEYNYEQHLQMHERKEGNIILKNIEEKEK